MCNPGEGNIFTVIGFCVLYCNLCCQPSCDECSVLPKSAKDTNSEKDIITLELCLTPATSSNLMRWLQTATFAHQDGAPALMFVALYKYSCCSLNKTSCLSELLCLSVCSLRLSLPVILNATEQTACISPHTGVTHGLKAWWRKCIKGDLSTLDPNNLVSEVGCSGPGQVTFLFLPWCGVYPNQKKFMNMSDCLSGGICTL